MSEMDLKTLLLTTIELSLRTSPTTGLSASDLNALARQFGLSDSQSLELIELLEQEGKLNVEWGGKVNTKELKPKTTSIRLGKGATFVGESAYIGAGAAVGSGAKASYNSPQPSVISQQQIESMSKLAVAVSLLSDLIRQERGDVRDALENLSSSTEALLSELRNSSPNKRKGASLLDDVNKSLDIATKSIGITATVVPHIDKALDLIRQGWHAAAALLGTT